MGCDIHMTMERCIHRLDNATIRTRIVALILAKRSVLRKSPDVSRTSAVWDLNSDLWARIAAKCPVTYQPIWFECPFVEWLQLPAAKFRHAHDEFSTKASSIDSDDGCAEVFDSLIEQERLTEVFEVLDLARCSYGMFGLFSHSVGRSSRGTRQLRCMRDGWPLDKVEPSGWTTSTWWMEDGNRDLHSLCFCTLAGLLAVDWSESAASDERSGHPFRPQGPTKCGPNPETQQRQLKTMLSLEGITAAHTERLKSGFEARKAESCSEEGTADREGLHFFDDQWAKFLDEDWRSRFHNGRAASNDSWEASNPLQSETRREIIGDEVLQQLRQVEAMILDAGIKTTDFRLIISFDC